MRKRLSKILITGGAGFIGSEFVRLLCAISEKTFPIVVDKLTYAGDLKRLTQFKGKFKFYKADICNKKEIANIFKKESPDIVVHFAAESHVDRSISDALPFIKTNVFGTQLLIDASLRHKVNKFIFISTDEVYGEILRGRFSENAPLRPGNPYAATKAAAELLVHSSIRTNNLPAIIIRPSNNYGPWQYPEKLIPLSIINILNGKYPALYGKGRNVREWIYVKDCAQGIYKVIQHGRRGQTYNLGGLQEYRNTDIIKILSMILRVKCRLKFVKDRPGHDLRYSLNSEKAHKELGWKPSIPLEEGLSLTVGWALANQDWLIKKLMKMGRQECRLR